MGVELKKKVWWGYLGEDLQELLQQSYLLRDHFVNRYKRFPQKAGEFIDYSFIVFPAAKAYEGFLKKVFLDLGFITSDIYFGKHFRIGRALNPDLEKVLRADESIYDQVVNLCGSKNLADNLWETWRSSRNQIFHWFPGEKNIVNFAEAEERIKMVIGAMDETFKECKIKK